MLRFARIGRLVAATATGAVTALAASSAVAVADGQEPGKTPGQFNSPTATPTLSSTPEAVLDATPPPGSEVDAASDCWTLVEVLPGVHQYVNICESPGDDDDDGDEGEGEPEGPTCDLSNKPYTEFCHDEHELDACRAEFPSPIPEDRWPEKGQDSEKEIFTYYECKPPEGEPYGGYSWFEPYKDSLPDQIWSAWGRLQTPAFTLSFEPAGMTYVGADTTFAVDGIGDGELVGSEAGGLRARGTFSHVELDPGDGGATVECDDDADTDDCTYVYLATSTDEIATDLEGRAAYNAQARLVYDVTYYMDGEQISMPGVPDTLESPWNGVPVPVGEIQVLVQ
ncbi:hypothetical protein CLV30_114117 [Haloactinopolyspora alba]|uniref:Uncharacterized protein n=1 Tax=Haloactinopolyspora alba TaxID=648780 RepID=A0A2P8DW43_9ACTN|nr:hypothetical protein [Haloactinopolyspora alba]PSL01387.1 hypothetical protein CLV30_114117 [Haloactinopolyspora alba]